MFNAIIFKPPTVLVNAASSVTAELTTAASNAANVRSAVLAAPAIDAPNAAIEPHSGALNGREGLYALAAPALRCVVIHPWVEGIAQGVGHYRYLSNRNAVNAAAKKLGDVLDTSRPTGVMDVLALLIAGSSYAELNQKLHSLLAVFSNETLFMCARRCAQLATLESDKVLLPDPASNARFNHAANATANPVAYKNIGQLVALGDAQQMAGSSAETDLVALTKKKQAIITSVTTAANNSLASFTGGAGQFYFNAGTSANAASRALLDADVGFEYPLAVCVLMTGAPGSLAMLKGMLQ
jgi:hypothetical protein